MKIKLQQLRDRISNLEWDAAQLATNLSAIGHETDVEGDQLNIALTSNRKDCQNLDYLAFDLCALYPELTTDVSLPEFGYQNPITVSIDKINGLLGTNLTNDDLLKLKRLGFSVDAETMQVRAPSFREGMSTNADVAEELLRLVGFRSINLQPLSKQSPEKSSVVEEISQLKNLLVDRGFFETLTYSFSASGSVELSNPFNAQEQYLRSDLNEGLLRTAAKNPFLKKIKSFEIGTVFNGSEVLALGLLIAGVKNLEPVAKELSDALGYQVEFSPVDDKLSQSIGIKQSNPQIFIVDLNDLPLSSYSGDRSETTLAKFTPISKYPPLTRDYSIKADEDTTREKIKQILREFDQVLIAEVIDVFQNPESGQYSTTIKIIAQNMNGSFTEDEIAKLDQKFADFLS